MKPKLTFLVLAGGVLLSIGLVRTASRVHQQQALEPTQNQLQWHAAEAKSRGQNKVTIPAPITDYLGSVNPSIEQAFKDYTVVVAQVISKRTYQSDGNLLRTWYTFRIVDSLTPLKNPACLGCLSLSPPPDVPIDYNTEFLVPRNGGSITLNGVEIEQKEAGFEQFQENEKYLLFISIYPNRIALPAGGPFGVFSLNEQGELTSFHGDADPIKEGVHSRFKGSLKLLKQSLNDSEKSDRPLIHP
jgi:hypothetical protein